MTTKTLTESEIVTLNEKFQLDLKYTDATHYRAAQVIWSLNWLDQKSAAAKSQGLEDSQLENTPSSAPSL